MPAKKLRIRGRPIGADRHIDIRSARRANLDVAKIAQIQVSLAIAQVEADTRVHLTTTRLDARPGTRHLRAAGTEDNGDGGAI
jgi:hypothetical protein